MQVENVKSDMFVNIYIKEKGYKQILGHGYRQCNICKEDMNNCEASGSACIESGALDLV